MQGLRQLRRGVALVLTVVMLVISMPLGVAQAALVSTEQVLATSDGAADRARVLAFLNRAEVREQIAALGVDPNEAAARVAALSDGQVREIAGQLDQLPAEAWQSLYALVDGTLPADALPAASSEMIVLRGQFEVVVAGPVGFQATSQSDVQVVVDGKSINSNGQQMVDFASGKHAFYVVIESPDQLKSLTIELTKPAGAGTQFTILGGV